MKLREALTGMPALELVEFIQEEQGSCHKAKNSDEGFPLRIAMSVIYVAIRKLKTKKINIEDLAMTNSEEKMTLPDTQRLSANKNRARIEADGYRNQPVSSEEKKCCPDPRGNELCTNGKDTYHEWNMRIEEEKRIVREEEQKQRLEKWAEHEKWFYEELVGVLLHSPHFWEVIVTKVRGADSISKNVLTTGASQEDTKKQDNNN